MISGIEGRRTNRLNRIIIEFKISKIAAYEFLQNALKDHVKVGQLKANALTVNATNFSTIEPNTIGYNGCKISSVCVNNVRALQHAGNAEPELGSRRMELILNKNRKIVIWDS